MKYDKKIILVFVFVEDILYTFTLLDANKDGRLSRQELKKGAFLMGMNPTDSELRAWWKVTDKNSECSATSTTSDYMMYNCL